MPGLFTNINGLGIFNDNTKNGGSVANGIFNDSSINTGIVDKGVFQGASKNQGTADTAYVGPNATNEGIINNPLSDNNVNKITYPTGEYVWIDIVPGDGTLLWGRFNYLDSYQANNSYTLPQVSFIQIAELEHAYWGLGRTFPVGIANQPPLEAVCKYKSNGTGSYYIEWPEAMDSLWTRTIYLERYVADSSYTLPPAVFVQIAELEHAYWGLGAGYPAGIANQPPLAAVCRFYAGGARGSLGIIEDGNGSYIKEWPEAMTSLWSKIRYQERHQADPSYTLPPAAFVQIPELGSVYWGISLDQGVANQPPRDAVCTFYAGGASNNYGIVEEGNGGYYKSWPFVGEVLWDESRYSHRKSTNPSYTLPEAAFIQISELGNAYWTDTIPNQPPIAAIATYKSNEQGGFYKEWEPSGTYLWGPSEYEAKLAS